MKQSKLILIFLLLASTAFADTEFSGFVKLNYLNYQSPYDSKDNNEVFQINRISVLSYITEKLSFEGSYELVQIYSDLNSPELAVDYSTIKKAYRINDFDPTLNDKDNDEEQDYYLNHNLDRLTLTWSGASYSIVAGRQQIAFGSGRVVNPTDIFTPFSFTAIDTEVRSGVDALRFRHQIGVMGQFDAGAVFGEDAKEENSAAYLLTKFTIGGFEIQPMVSVFQKAEFAGLDFGTSLFGASFWIESSWVKPEDEESYTRVVTGFERQLSQDITLYLEYYYNGAGEKNPSDYPLLETKFAYLKGGVYLKGQNYISLGSSIQITPLHLISPLIITNLGDGSAFINLSWEWNFAEDFYLNAGSLLCLGERSDDANNPESEFGSIPTTFFLRFRYYF